MRRWLRLLALIGMACGPWQSFKNRPRKVVPNGKRFFRLADGSFSPMWGRRVEDPALIAELERLHQAAGPR